MPTNDFDTQLDTALDFSTTDPFGESYQVLKRIADSIAKKLNENLTSTPIAVEIEPGFQATMGQQLRVILRIPAKGFRDTLFRAYVPENGWPIQLDLYGEQPEACSDEQALQDRVLEFLAKIKDRMASYRDYAS